MFGADDRGPVVPCPGPRFDDVPAVDQGPVALVPVRPLPAGGLQEYRAELALAVVERAGAQRARVLRRLLRVDDVVDLAEALRAPLAHIGRTVREVLEAAEIGLPEVDVGHLTGQPLRHRAADPGGVGDPHRLGDPEVVDLV